MAQRTREDRDTKRRTREDTSEAQPIAPEQRNPRRKKASDASSSTSTSASATKPKPAAKSKSRRGAETTTPADREGGVPEELNPDDFE